MSKAKAVRKKVLKKSKEIRRKTEGLPRAKSNRGYTRKLIKEFNAYVAQKMREGNLVSHEDVGLPDEVSGEDVLALIKSQNDNITENLK